VFHHAEFGRSELKSVGINTGEPQNWEALEPRSLGMEGVADSKIHAPPQYVTLRNENPKIGERWGPLGVWALLTPENKPSFLLLSPTLLAS